MIVIIYFMFSVYCTNPLLGSPAAVFELLKEASVLRPVDGNQDGSYLTMKSNFALVFGIIQLCSGSGTVFLDQAYWQRAIASRATTAVRAYILGGLAWFAVPFGFATTLGLAAAALTNNPAFPTYPNPMSSSQVSSGLASAFAASVLLGKGGAVALLIVLFMAVTSCASAELIAVSSILTFDIYKTYVKPTATSTTLITVSHIMICVFGFTMAIFACIWNAIGIDLGWLFLVMGLIIGGAVFPAAFAITWRGQTTAGAISGALVGLVAGLIAWLVTAKQYYGPLSIATTGLEYPTLAGNLAAVMTGLIVSVAVSLIRPDKIPFDWETTRSINAVITSDSDYNTTAVATPQNEPALNPEKENPEADAVPKDLAHPQADGREEDKEAAIDHAIEGEPAALRSAFKLACIASFVLPLIMDFLIPIPMFLSHYVFSQGFFTAWVVISFIWVFCSAAITTILPIWETAGFFGNLLKQIGSGL
jgi:Na+/proline symporter